MLISADDCLTDILPIMKPFHFKQFSIQQDQCAMKVTLDACILGALSDPYNLKQQKAISALDIGSGTGLLSLMLAQKGVLDIHAVEVDSAAVQQSAENIRNSPFSKQISLHHSDIQSVKLNQQFDLIISNPPFFTEHLQGPNKQRNLARHNHGLSFEALACAIKQYLNPNAVAWILLPVDEFNRFCSLLNNKQLTLQTIHWIKSRPQKTAHRVVFSLIHSPIAPSKPLQPEYESALCIHQEQGSQYSLAFKALLKDYYLKF